MSSWAFFGCGGEVRYVGGRWRCGGGGGRRRRRRRRRRRVIDKQRMNVGRRRRRRRRRRLAMLSWLSRLLLVRPRGGLREWEGRGKQ